MKYPNEISSIFFKKLILSGWFEDRDIVQDLPSHIKDLPIEVQNFLNEIWFINIVDDFLYVDEFQDINSSFIRYSFGESTKKLLDYSDKKNEYLSKYSNLIDSKIRNFGFKDGRELLIDETGKIYEIPDSGDIIFLGGRFYEGLYNLIFDNSKSYMVIDDYKLLKINDNEILDKNLTLKDF